jgi:hypothetical protein
MHMQPQMTKMPPRLVFPIQSHHIFHNAFIIIV